MKSTITALILSFLFSAPVAFAAAPNDILFILDASGSMEALVGGSSQMEIAKQSIRETLPAIPADTPVGLRVYAHRIPKSDKESSCKDTELMVPMEAGAATKIASAISGLMPKGYTPIAISLKAAAEDFRAREAQHVIILLSDGEETCGGDPVAEAKNLIAQGFKVNIHTIGFRVDATVRAQLKAISDATGGMYYDATDAASLTANLKEATQKALFLEKPREEGRGQEIRGGSQFAEAVKLEKDIEYHLDHHQRVNEYDYFYVDAKKGQLITVSAMTLGHGVNVKEGNVGEENKSPYNGFKVNDESFKLLGGEELIGASHGKKSRSFAVDRDQKLYVLIGSAYDNVHKESPFKIEVKDLFDANTTTDAGNEITDALEIQVGDYPKNYIQNDGDQDYFKVPVKAGEVYEVKSLPESTSLSINLEVLDVNRVRLAGAHSPNGGALARAENVTIPEDGVMYIKISTYAAEMGSAYSLSIKKKEGVAAVATKEERVLPTEVAKKANFKKEPDLAQSHEDADKSEGLLNNRIFLKVLLVLSVLGNIVLGIVCLIAKFKSKK